MNNVNKYFPVVGYVEEFEDFLRVLEKLLPQYFKGVHRLFLTSKGDVSPRANMSNETNNGLQP